MEFKQHTTPSALETYSFWWSEARLILGAIALLLGGVPLLLKILFIPGIFSIALMFLKLAWIVSGVASAYMLYRFWTGGKTVFGGKNQKDLIAFWFSVVTGLNLGITGLLGTNIGMSIASGKAIFAVAGVAYIIVAVYLHRRWNASGKKIFGSAAVPPAAGGAPMTTR